jgi:hypothetical protein
MSRDARGPRQRTAARKRCAEMVVSASAMPPAAAAGASVTNTMHSKTEEEVKVSFNWCLAWCLRRWGKV